MDIASENFLRVFYKLSFVFQLISEKTLDSIDFKRDFRETFI